MKVQTADEARQQRTDEARAIIRWLAANPMEWGIVLTCARLAATADNVRAYEAGDTEQCASCGRESTVAAYNDEARPICGRCARGAR